VRLLVEWAASCSRAGQPNPVVLLASRGPSWRDAIPDWSAKPSIVCAHSVRGSPPGRSLLRQLVAFVAQGDQQIGQRLVKAGDALVFEGVPDVVHVDPHRAQVAHDAGRRTYVGVDGAGDGAVVLERGDGGLGHRVDRAGADEAVDVAG